MAKEMHSQEDVPGAEEEDDFGGEPETPEGKVEGSGLPKKSDEPMLETVDGGVIGAPSTKHVQHNQGPGPSQAYGASVPVEGKRNEGPTDFNHPAAVEPQRIVWIPADPLGLGAIESKALNQAGVEASTEHATMDGKGHVDIDSHPPGSDPTTMFG